MTWLPSASSPHFRTGSGPVATPARPRSTGAPNTPAAAAGLLSGLLPTVPAFRPVAAMHYAQQVQRPPIAAPATRPPAPRAERARIRVPPTAAQLLALQQRQQRKDIARQNLRQARKKFEQDTQTVSLHHRRADRMNLTGSEFLARRDRDNASRQLDAEGRPRYLAADGSVDLDRFRRDRREKRAAWFTTDGGLTYPFLELDGKGGTVGNVKAHQAHLHEQRAKKVLDAGGRPLFHDPATGTVDITGFNRWEIRNRRKRLEKPGAAGVAESVEASAARGFLDAHGRPRFICRDGSVHLMRFRNEVGAEDQARALRAETDRRARQAPAPAAGLLL